MAIQEPTFRRQPSDPDRWSREQAPPGSAIEFPCVARAGGGGRSSRSLCGSGALVGGDQPSAAQILTQIPRCLATCVCAPAETSGSRRRHADTACRTPRVGKGPNRGPLPKPTPVSKGLETVHADSPFSFLFFFFFFSSSLLFFFLFLFFFLASPFSPSPSWFSLLSSRSPRSSNLPIPSRSALDGRPSGVRHVEKCGKRSLTNQQARTGRAGPAQLTGTWGPPRAGACEQPNTLEYGLSQTS
eukprot:9469276-Pyramimonas_sp.AAC.1